MCNTSQGFYQSTENGKMNKRDVRVIALNMVEIERHRQVNVLGYGAFIDDGYEYSELALAAASYCVAETYDESTPPSIWPWSDATWKPSPDNRLKELTKAGALILAEMERLLRKQDNE